MTKKFRFRCRLLLLWLLFAGSLTPVRGFSQTDTIRCWEIGYRFPVYNQQGRVDTSIANARRMYMDGNLIMYTFLYGYATGVDGQQLTSGTGYLYFIYGKDSLSGIRYDDQHPELTRPFDVDSLKRSMVPYLKQFELFKKGVGRLVSAVSHAGGGQLEETYCDLNWNKHPNQDSCYVTYSDRFNLLPREMSLDKKMDSLYQKRLCQFKMVIHAGTDPQTHQKFDRSEWIFTLKEMRDFDRDNAKAWFSRYRHAGPIEGAAGAAHP